MTATDLATFGDPRLPERFWRKVQYTDTCWLWVAANRTGYGIFAQGYSTHGAHRVAFDALVAPIPDGLQIDHICRVPRCVNPSHLQVVSPQQNCENVGPHRDNKSGVRGVWWIPNRKRWAVQVCSQGRKYSGKSFTDLADAEQAAIALRNRLMTNNLADSSVRAAS